MKRQSTVFPIFALSVVTLCAQEPRLTTIDYPGAAGTAAWGINAYRDVVGTYSAADSSGHGFLYSGGKLTAIDYPGAALTGVYGINNRGEIAGLYATTATGPHHGFVLTRAGKYTSIEFPGASATEAAAINDKGEVAGLYTLPDNSTHGFVYTGGQYRNIDFPGASTTFGNGISARGDVVENYTLGGVTRGLLWSNDAFTSIEVPGANFTGAYGVNANGVIVGRYRDASTNLTHGYIWNAGKFRTVDIPDSTLTAIASINDQGTIVGRYVTGGVNHGFVMEQPPARYELTDLGILPGGTFSQATYVNDRGLIVGIADLPDGSQHGVVWQGGQIMDIGKPGLGGPNSGVFGFNARGQALVQAESQTVDPNQENFCAYGTGLTCLPAIWQGGKMKALPTLGGPNGTVGVINAAGIAAGIAETSMRDPECPLGKGPSGTGPQVLDFEAVVWQGGQVRGLAPLAGDKVGMAFWINDNGQVVGVSGSCADTSLPPVAFGPHAVLWERDGTATDLGNLGGTVDFKAGVGNNALSINNLGQVVGLSALKGNETNHGFLWNRGTGMRDLGTLPGDANSVGSCINDRGQVVGISFGENGPRGYLWDNGVMTDFNDLVGPDSPLYVLFTTGINNSGEVVGFGVTDAGETHAFAARPVGGPLMGSRAPSMARTLIRRR
jgi:probable HAF family extracellular repeat protein